MPQIRLPEDVWRVRGTDEEVLRKFVENLTLKALVKRVKDLADTKIVLGRLSSDEQPRYSIKTTIPLCKREFNADISEASLYIDWLDHRIWFVVQCTPEAPDIDRQIIYHELAYLSNNNLIVYTYPGSVIAILNELLGKPCDIAEPYCLGTGPDILLDLAKKAEESGDSGMAGVLRNLHAMLKASMGAVENARQKDYSRAAEEEVKGRAERAVELLKKARAATWDGDTERFKRLLDEVLLEVDGQKVTLWGAINYVRGARDNEEGEKVHNLVRVLDEYVDKYYDYYSDVTRKRPSKTLFEIAVYGAIVDAARRLGLPVVAPKPKAT